MSLVVRAARDSDLGTIARIARAAGQSEEWSGSDPAYVRHLLEHGRVLLAFDGGLAVGFGATRTISRRDGVNSMLCDLFVDPAHHGRGCGRALLAELWPDPDEPRMTFSSLHSHALPLYTSVGLDAWWPLLYLSGDASVLPTDAWSIEGTSPNAVAALELAWTGVDRAADHEAWARRPKGRSLLVMLDGRPMLAGTAAGGGVEHLVSHPDLDAHHAAAGVLAALAGAHSGDGHARICLPAPHPAVRALLSAGWHVTDMDIFMATSPDLLDARRTVPSPALA
jgi:GNAT superfamily N-acetyltransferase